MPGSPETILLEPDAQRRVRREFPATAALMPGRVAGVGAAGAAYHAGGLIAAMPPFRLFVDLNLALAGSISTPYGVGDPVRILYALPGDLLYAWLAAGQNVHIGTAMMVGTDGLLHEQVPETELRDVVATAEERIDNQAPASVAVPIIARIV